MLKQITEDYYNEMMSKLEQVLEEDSPQVIIHKNAMLIVQEYIFKTRDLIMRRGFDNSEEEIWFFKIEKPRFHAWLIYYGELLALENSRPATLNNQTNDHYHGHLAYIDRFFRKNEFFYQYFRSGAHDLDHFFLRDTPVYQGLGMLLPMVDSHFGTGLEYLFSKFIAFEMLLIHLGDLITQEVSVSHPMAKLPRKSGNLKWTGEIINLVELLYALHGTSQINNGEVSLTELARVFQELFNVNLNRHSRSFEGIKRRKGESPARFMDTLKQEVLNRIDDSIAKISSR